MNQPNQPAKGANTGHLSTADKLIRRRRIFRSFVAKSLAKRGITQKMADEITGISGSLPFLFLHIYWFIVWVIINSGLIPGFAAFDPYPFGLLTMIVSLEAIVLSVFVLLSQNRQSQVDSLREELDLQVNLIAEEEITKALELLSDIQKHLKIRKDDWELDRMLNDIDTSYIERSLQKQVDMHSQRLVPKLHLNGNGNGSQNKPIAKDLPKPTIDPAYNKIVK